MHVAIMIALGGTVIAWQSDIEPERNCIPTFVAVKCDSNWCFTAFQNSQVQYIGRPEVPGSHVRTMARTIKGI